jgi:hypothetical protein
MGISTLMIEQQAAVAVAEGRRAAFASSDALEVPA